MSRSFVPEEELESTTRWPPSPGPVETTDMEGTDVFDAKSTDAMIGASGSGSDGGKRGERVKNLTHWLISFEI